MSASTFGVKDAIQRVIEGRELTIDEASATLDQIMTGLATGAQIGALAGGGALRHPTHAVCAERAISASSSSLRCRHPVPLSWNYSPIISSQMSPSWDVICIWKMVPPSACYFKLAMLCSARISRSIAANSSLTIRSRARHSQQ